MNDAIHDIDMGDEPPIQPLQPLKKWLQAAIKPLPSEPLPTAATPFNIVGLGAILARIQDLQNLNQTLLACLPVHFKPHCSVLAWNAPELVIQVTSSVWAMRIQYIRHDLLTYFQKNSPYCIHKIRLHIRPAPVELPPPPPPLEPTRLSAQEAQLFINLAERVQDEGLKQALQRLATYTNTQ